jgi:hypothetical protein
MPNQMTKQIIMTALIFLSSVSAFAGEGQESVTCKGKGLTVNLWQNGGGDSGMSVESGGKKKDFSLDMQDGEQSANLTVVIESKIGVVVAVGIKNFSADVQLVSIPKTAKTLKPNDTFTAVFSGYLPNGNYHSARLSCVSKWDL